MPRRGDDAGAVFIEVKCFDGQTRTVAEHLVKGRKVAVTGSLEQAVYELAAWSEKPTPQAGHRGVQGNSSVAQWLSRRGVVD